MRHFFILALFALAAAGCAPKSDGTQAAQTPSAASAASVPVSAVKAVDPSNAGSVTGKVTYRGEVPVAQILPMKGNPECSAMHPGGEVSSEELLVKDGALKNAFVYVKSGLEGYRFDPPAQAAAIDNKGCLYVPHVLGVQTGQAVTLLNSDPTLHNMHAYGKANKPFNIGLPFQGMKQTRKFTDAEVMVSMKCDVHPWMLGYVGVLPHPYFAVTGEDGAFALKGLPPGEFEVAVWHEKLGERAAKVTVTAGGTAEASFDYTT